MKAPNGKPLVLLFSTTAAPERAARLHVADCNMVHTKSRAMKAITEDIDATVRDLNEREFPVKACKCVGGTLAERKAMVNQ